MPKRPTSLSDFRKLLWNERETSDQIMNRSCIFMVRSYGGAAFAARSGWDAVPPERRERRGWPVRRVLSPLARGMAIHLGRASPRASCDLPGRRGGDPLPPRGCGRPYSVLRPAGLAMPPPSPGARWALTPPFHPCPSPFRDRGGLLSVALSLGSPRPGVTRRRLSLPPGRSSPLQARPSGHPRAPVTRRAAAPQAPAGRAAPSRISGRGRSCGRARPARARPRSPPAPASAP